MLIKFHEGECVNSVMKDVIYWIVKDKKGRGHALIWGITGGSEVNHEIFQS